MAYYQQAQILDEVSFATVRQLSVIPGAMVGDFGGNTGIDQALIGG